MLSAATMHHSDLDNPHHAAARLSTANSRPFSEHMDLDDVVRDRRRGAPKHAAAADYNGLMGCSLAVRAQYWHSWLAVMDGAPAYRLNLCACRQATRYLVDSSWP